MTHKMMGSEFNSDIKKDEMQYVLVKMLGNVNTYSS